MRMLAAASTIHVTIAATQVNIRSSLKIVVEAPSRRMATNPKPMA